MCLHVVGFPSFPFYPDQSTANARQRIHLSYWVLVFSLLLTGRYSNVAIVARSCGHRLDEKFSYLCSYNIATFQGRLFLTIHVMNRCCRRDRKENVLEEQVNCPSSCITVFNQPRHIFASPLGFYKELLSHWTTLGHARKPHVQEEHVSCVHSGTVALAYRHVIE
jgi:hypothetical protein